MTAERRIARAESAASMHEIVERVQAISVENERLVRQLAEGEYRFRHLAKAVWQVQEEERRNIALELHDGIGQLLTALINHLQHSAADTTQDDASQATRLAASALAEVRRMSRALRPSVLDDLGLEAAIRWLLRTTAESSGLEISLSWPQTEVRLDKQTETLVFRIVQEALTNIVKHARATRARIVVESAGHTLQVSIVDNGSGFDVEAVLAASDRGFGARGMRDRAELFGGRLRIESEPGEGTSVFMEIPEEAA